MDSWYVRVRGRILGPFGFAQLQEMRDRGQLQAFFEVSTDSKTWQSAGSVDGLFPSMGITRRAAGPLPAYAPASAPAPASAKSAPTRVKTASSLPLILIIGAVLGLISILGLFVIGLGIYLGTHSSAGAAANSSGVIQFTPDTDPAERHRVLKDSVALIICGLHVTRADGSRVELAESSGSGFAVTRDGYILTNRHVVEKTDNATRSSTYKQIEKQQGVTIVPTVWVFFSRSEKYVANIRYISNNYDLAVLKIDRQTPFHFALSGKPIEQVVPDLSVTACGFPGMQRDILKEATGEGIKKSSGPVESQFPTEVFSPNQEAGKVTTEPYEYRGSGLLSHPKCIQHTADIFHGNSGGPLILADGTVIGINTYGFTISKEGDSKKVNLSITLPQIQAEIDRNVSGIVWR